MSTRISPVAVASVVSVADGRSTGALGSWTTTSVAASNGASIAAACRARMLFVPNRSTQATTTRPSGSTAGCPGWSANPRSSAGPNGAMPSALIRRRTLRYVAVSES